MSDGTPAPDDSGTSTPMSRFKSLGATPEEQLKSSTVGLVTLSDFKKRRVEALGADDSSSPSSDQPMTKKKRKPARKAPLSFSADADDDEEETSSGPSRPISRPATPNSSVPFLAKPQTKSALAREAAAQDALRRGQAAVAARVRATPFVLPFSFYEGGSAAAGGAIRLRKGAQVWLFLERARKVGAEGRKGWARISVDDLMCVVDDLVLPHHYEFYWFMKHKTKGFTRTLFEHSADPTGATPEDVPEEEEKKTPQAGLTLASQRREAVEGPQEVADAELEGFGDDPGLVRVVDRRWYEKNKHVFPMNSWQDFDPEKDYSTGVRTDAQGNAYFSLR